MVYCGKPSKSCAPCRAKRKKCDLAVPACGQCIRAKWKCHGYRNQLDLTFRDQTRDVTLKMEESNPDRQSESAVVKASNTTNIKFQAHDSPYGVAASFPLGYLSLPEDLATVLFFRHYVEGDSSGSKTDLDFLPVIYNHATVRGALSEIIVALGMTLSVEARQDAEVMGKAQRKYASALRQTNESLSDPKRAKSDELLMAVMLLALYETRTFSTPQSLRAWKTHLDGAQLLLRLRGLEQFQTRAGIRMFIRLRGQILTSCLLRKEPAPSDIMLLSSLCPLSETEDEAAVSKLSDIVARFCSIRALYQTHMKLADTNPDPEQGPESELLLSAILDIDAALASWASDLPPQFDYTRTTCDTSSLGLYSDCYDMYESPFIAFIWNSYRCARILAHEMILRQLRAPSSSRALTAQAPTYDPRWSASEQSIAALSYDICASIPFLLYHPHISSHEQMTRANPTMQGGSAVVWPLYVVADCDCNSNSMRRWAMMQLNRVAQSTGVQQAAAMADLLRAGIDIATWNQDGIIVGEDA